MTPKEKAEELVTLFIEYTNLFNPDNPENNGWEKDMDAAKQCALIAVDEILPIVNKWSAFHMQKSSEVIFWEEVKQEIEKL